MSSAIEWTDETWNPATGCFEVSPGCAHCYAKTFAERWRGVPGHHYEQGFDLRLWPERLELPFKWKRPRMVFVNSMSDLFFEGIPDEFIARVFATMAACPQHTFQVLTKRPERMLSLLNGGVFPLLLAEQCVDWPGAPDEDMPVLPNVWLGVSIENRRFVHRADLLRQTPAVVRFISAEPLLGPLVYDSDIGYVTDGWDGEKPPHLQGDPYSGCWLDGAALPELDLTRIDWLIVGGESGPGFRPMRLEWARDLRDAAIADGTAFFFKQRGGRNPKAGGRELDGRTWDEMPERQAVPA